MTVQAGKDANINITGVAMTNVTTTKWTLDHSPTFHTYMGFGDGAPKNEELFDNWTVTIEGFANADVATFPDVGAAITDMDLLLEDDATADKGFTCAAGVVSQVSVDAPADGVVSFTMTIIPNGVAMTAYGTVA